jgi:hypothetical protein
VTARSSGASSNALGFNPNLLSSIAGVTQHKKGRRRKAPRDPCGRPGAWARWVKPTKASYVAFLRLKGEKKASVRVNPNLTAPPYSH